MQLQVSLLKKIVLTVAIMCALILLVYFCKIPNPNMILIAGLVLCSALFGFGGGIVAAVIMLVKRGGNRQQLHEIIRELSHEATRRVKMEGKSNNLIEAIAQNDAFALSMEEIKEQLNPALYVGRAPSQTVEFNKNVIEPILGKYEDNIKSELSI